MRWERAAVGVVVLSLLGPYLVGGVRTEQAVVYALVAALFCFLPWRWFHARPPLSLLTLALSWCALLLVAAAGSASPPSASWASGSVWAGLDNLALPLATTAAVCMLVNSRQMPQPLLLVAAKAIAITAAANGALSMAMTRLDLSPYLRPWWGSETLTGITAELAAELGRFSGLFNQPAEAALYYSLGGVCAIFAWGRTPHTLYPFLVLIGLGGALSVSKVFLLVGAPVLLWQLWSLGRSRLAAIGLSAFGILVVIQSGFLEGWVGTNYLLRLLNPPASSDQRSWLEFYTAGRLGDESTLRNLTDEVLAKAPFFGFGSGGLRAPYDNGWVEALVVAGVFGAGFYTIALILIARIASLQREAAHRRLGFGITVVTAGASFGLPALTANRAGTAIWLLVALLAYCAHESDATATQVDLLIVDGSPNDSKETVVGQHYFQDGGESASGRRNRSHWNTR